MSIDTPKRPARCAKEGGYTLTEMLVVLLILGLLVAVITPTTIDQMNRAKARAAQLQLEAISAALASFSADVGRAPTQEEGLKALVTRPPSTPTWTGPYLRSMDRLIDPWNRPYIFKTTSEIISIETLGADGKPGGSGADADLSLS